MAAVFSDLVEAAARPELLKKLRTSDLPEDRKDEQYAKLKALKDYGDGLLKLTDSRFVARFSDNHSVYLCLHCEGINPDELLELDAQLESIGVFRSLLDESMFLYLTLSLRKNYRVKPENLIKRTADTIISICEGDYYDGHAIDDLVHYFPSINVYTISEDSIFLDCNKWFIASFIAVASESYRSDLLTESHVGKISALQNLSNVNPENLYYALTSRHWKQAFFEVYRCIEPLYFLPWVLNLKRTYGYTKSGLEIAKQLRASIRWREKERESIEELFELLDEAIVKDANLLATQPFADLAGINNGVLRNAALGRRFYKLRNILVHQEDYDEPGPLNITEECWPVVLDYALHIALSLYQTHSVDIPFNFGINAKEAAKKEAPAPVAVDV